MSNDVNLCTFIGRLGQNPEQKAMPSGDAVTNFSLACGWKSKNAEGVEWVNIVAFGRLAEIIGQYMKKGSRVYIAGKLRTRNWEDKEGNKRYTTEIVARDLQMLDSKPDGAQSAPKAAEAPFTDDVPF